MNIKRKIVVTVILIFTVLLTENVFAQTYWDFTGAKDYSSSMDDYIICCTLTQPRMGYI